MESRDLVSVDFPKLSNDEKQQASELLCDFLCDLIKEKQKDVGETNPIAILQDCCNLLHKDFMVLGQDENEELKRQQFKEKLASIGHLRLLVDVCERAIPCILVAKLHANVKSDGNKAVTKRFQEKVEALKGAYKLKQEVSTLIGYKEAGKLMLNCLPLAFLEHNLLHSCYKNVLEMLKCGHLKERILNTAMMMPDKDRQTATNAQTHNTEGAGVVEPMEIGDVNDLQQTVVPAKNVSQTDVQTVVSQVIVQADVPQTDVQPMDEEEATDEKQPTNEEIMSIFDMQLRSALKRMDRSKCEHMYNARCPEPDVQIFLHDDVKKICVVTELQPDKDVIPMLYCGFYGEKYTGLKDATPHDWNTYWISCDEETFIKAGATERNAREVMQNLIRFANSILDAKHRT